MFHVELVKQEVLLLLPVATSLYFFSSPSLKVEGFYFLFFLIFIFYFLSLTSFTVIFWT